MGVHYLVGEVLEPDQEPFLVVEVDSEAKRPDGKMQGTIRGLYMTKDEAEAAAKRFGGTLQ